MTFEDMQKYLEKRLEEWADWYRYSEYGRGYPHCSTLYLIQRGLVMAKSDAPKIEPENPDAEEINAWVTELKKYKQELGKALQDKYFAEYGETVETIARKNKISVRALESRIQLAKYWLMGRLSEKNGHKMYI